MTNFANEDEFKKWLYDQPREIALICAARASLRVAPFLVSRLFLEDDLLDSDLILPIFRLTASEFAYGSESIILPDASMGLICSTISEMLDNKSEHFIEGIFSVVSVVDDPAGALLSTFEHFNDSTERYTDEIIRDINFLAGNYDSEDIFLKPIWLENKEPEKHIDHWVNIKKYFSQYPDEHWHVWTDWWEDRRDGKPYNIEMEREIALIPNEDWQQGPTHVNAMIAEIRAKYALPNENRRGLPFGAQDGIIGLRSLSIRSADDDAALFHAALLDDMTRLAACLADCGKSEDPYGKLAVSADAMMVALGSETTETHTSKLWLAARKLREIDRIDRRTQTEFGVNEPPLDTEIGEALRTTLTTFTAFCLSVPALQKLEQANRDNAEMTGIPIEAIQPILAMIRAENDKFKDEIRAAFDGLMADARSNIKGVAERGEAVTLASVENLIHRLIAEAIAEDRQGKPGPFWEAYKKKAGEHTANLTLGSLTFTAKAVIAYYFADLVGFTDQLPNGDNYRDSLEKIIRSPSK